MASWLGKLAGSIPVVGPLAQSFGEGVESTGINRNEVGNFGDSAQYNPDAFKYDGQGLARGYRSDARKLNAGVAALGPTGAQAVLPGEQNKGQLEAARWARGDQYAAAGLPVGDRGDPRRGMMAQDLGAASGVAANVHGDQMAAARQALTGLARSPSSAEIQGRSQSAKPSASEKNEIRGKEKK